MDGGASEPHKSTLAIIQNPSLVEARLLSAKLRGTEISNPAPSSRESDEIGGKPAVAERR
jgi:hypothetical protein